MDTALASLLNYSYSGRPDEDRVEIAWRRTCARLLDPDRQAGFLPGMRRSTGRLKHGASISQVRQRQRTLLVGAEHCRTARIQPARAAVRLVSVGIGLSRLV